MKKSKKLAKISTAVIGIYLLFLVVIGVKTALLCHDFSKIGMLGIDQRLCHGAGSIFYAAWKQFWRCHLFPADVRNCVCLRCSPGTYRHILYIDQERKTANRCDAETGYGYCGTAVFSHFVKKCGSFLLDGCTSVDGHGRI